MSWSVPGYVAEELVGFGAMGEVWRGRDSTNGELVALKRLRAAGPDSSERLLREAAVLADLDHPHLLRLRETVRSGEEWVLVLDYAVGGSLAALLRERGTLRPGEVVTALAPVAAALAYAHGEGLVHGDVTPSNILLAGDGRPWLADLGLARIGGEDGAVHTTPEYADPVVARGCPPGAPTDVFAVAAIAFHALTGAAPWSAATAQEALARAASADRADLRTLSPRLPAAMAETIERALSVDPAARGTAAEFALDLRHSCRPEPIELPGRSRPGGLDPACSAAMTHVVRNPDAARPRHAAPPPAARSARDRWRSVRARWTVPRWRVLRSPGLRAGVLGMLSVAVAVRLGVAWAGTDTVGAGGSGAVRGATGSIAATSVPAPASRDPSAPSRFVDRAARRPGAQARGSVGGSGDATWSDGRWAGVLAALDAARARAFAASDPATLAQVYVPGSDVLARDTARIARLKDRGVSATGVRHAVNSVRLVQAGAARVVLRVEEKLRGYEVHREGRTHREPATAVKRYRITLRQLHGRWLIEELAATES